MCEQDRPVAGSVDEELASEPVGAVLRLGRGEPHQPLVVRLARGADVR